MSMWSPGFSSTVVSGSSGFLHGNSGLPDSRKKLPVLESATHEAGIVSLWPYSVAQSELTQIHGERAQLPLLDGKSVKKSTATFNLPRDCVYILELMCRLNELKHIKCLGNDDCSQCPTSLVFSHCF